MKQICKFDTKPQTINNGGYKKGRYILWLNLGVSEIDTQQENSNERWESMTDRLVIDSWSLYSLLDVLNPAHLIYATNIELMDILSAFGKADDLESWKAIRAIQIKGYDQSELVNGFQLGPRSMWLDKATRVGLVNSVTIEKNAGRKETTLWYGSDKLQLDVDDAISMLSQLELYALECYNVTARHLAAIENAETIEVLKDFDISADYPKMLTFPVSD